jgi:hypothetical protein
LVGVVRFGRGCLHEALLSRVTANRTLTCTANEAANFERRTPIGFDRATETMPTELAGRRSEI